MADQFLKQGRIVSVKNRGEADENYDAQAKGTWRIPTVVFVDYAWPRRRDVASALQDNKRALVLAIEPSARQRANPVSTPPA